MDRHSTPCRPLCFLYLQATNDDPGNDKKGKRTARNEHPPCSSSPSAPEHNLVKRTGCATIGNRRITTGTIQTPNTSSFTKKSKKSNRNSTFINRLLSSFYPLINAQKKGDYITPHNLTHLLNPHRIPTHFHLQTDNHQPYKQRARDQKWKDWGKINHRRGGCEEKSTMCNVPKNEQKHTTRPINASQIPLLNQSTANRRRIRPRSCGKRKTMVANPTKHNLSPLWYNLYVAFSQSIPIANISNPRAGDQDNSIHIPSHDIATP